MIKLAFVFVSIALAACGGSKGTSGPTTTAPTTAPVSGGTLTITALKFYDGEENGVKLAADGKLSVKSKHSEGGKPAVEEWHDLATIAADGTVTAIGTAKAGKLEADGSFKSNDGTVAPFKLDGEVLTLADKHITIDDKGVLQGGNPEFNLHVSGITDAGSKRTALLVLALVLGGPKTPAPEPTSGP